MAKARKQHGWVVAKIEDRKTGEHVGFIYQWDNGERQNAWFEGAKPQDDVVYKELDHESEN